MIPRSTNDSFILATAGSGKEGNIYSGFPESETYMKFAPSFIVLNSDTDICTLSTSAESFDNSIGSMVDSLGSSYGMYGLGDNTGDFMSDFSTQGDTTTSISSMDHMFAEGMSQLGPPLGFPPHAGSDEYVKS